MLKSQVSVPIWGLFNLTYISSEAQENEKAVKVSVPIWGLFNLTKA